MEQVFAIMIYFGSIFFIAFGFCVASTAEGIYSKFGRNFLTSLTVLGLVSLIIGLIGNNAHLIDHFDTTPLENLVKDTYVKNKLS